MRKALVVRGGWDGHEPVQTSDVFIPFLKQNGFEVVVSDTRDAYLDDQVMRGLHLIIHNWTAWMPPENGEWSKRVQKAVESGVGLAGWHGGLCDSCRGDTGWYLLTGGQFIGHPNHGAPYTVNITDHASPLTRGVGDFVMNGTEQYYMAIDPGSHVLATTTFGTELHEVGCQVGAVMPVAWTRTWGKGRVFYMSIGHTAKDLQVPQVRTITERGLLYAAAAEMAGAA
jgi:type 1 glutamine amidotransferase